MLICIQTKNEPLPPCDVLIIKESASVTIQAADLAAVIQSPPDVKLVKEKENLMLKCGILIAQLLGTLDKDAVGGPVQIACTDKPTLDAVCSLEYALEDGTAAKCVTAGANAKPSAPKVRNLARPAAKQAKGAAAPKATKPAPKPAGPEAAAQAAQKAETAENAQNAESAENAQNAENAENAPARLPEGLSMDNVGTPVPEDISTILSDPGLVKPNGEVNLDKDLPEPERAKNPAETPAGKIMALVRGTGIPSSQIPGVLDAIREAIDPEITLPMQVKMRVAKDGASDDMAPDETAKRIAPIFSEVKSLMEEAQKA